MRNHFTLLKIVLCLVVTGLIGIAITRTITQNILIYEGCSLETLFAALDSNSASEQDRAVRAFNDFGAKALPFLLSQVQVDNPTLRDRCQTWVNTKVFHKILPMNCGIGELSGSIKRSFALIKAFEILGDRAAPSIQQLSRLITIPESQGPASACLVAMGPCGMKQIEQILQGGDLDTRRALIFKLENAKATKTNAVTLLLHAMKDSDPLIRHYAAYALGHLNCRPEECVPALTSALGDVDSRVRYISLYALTNFGVAAVPALPLIRKLEIDPEENIRKSAVEMAGKLEAIASQNQIAEAFPVAP